MKADKIQTEGIIVKSYPWGKYDVQLSDEFGSIIVQCYVSGNMRKNCITLLEGDVAVIELTPYDLSKGRITFRKK